MSQTGNKFKYTIFKFMAILELLLSAIWSDPTFARWKVEVFSAGCREGFLQGYLGSVRGADQTAEGAQAPGAESCQQGRSCASTESSLAAWRGSQPPLGFPKAAALPPKHRHAPPALRTPQLRQRKQEI